ncbi:paired amphipathic helix protein Sin3a [Cryptococcus neoformans]|nr:paired amphipathic helix protein Sin3a [Cryptococcus neoformans var. grubii]
MSKLPSSSPMLPICLMNSSNSCPRMVQAVWVCFPALSCKLPAPRLPFPKRSQAKRGVSPRKVKRWDKRSEGRLLRVLSQLQNPLRANALVLARGRVLSKTSSLDSPSSRLNNKLLHPPTKSRSLTRSRNSLTTRWSITSSSSSSTSLCRT